MKLTSVKTCDHCPIRFVNEWLALASTVRLELRRHVGDLTYRGVFLAEEILNLSISVGAESLYVPKLNLLRELTGIDKPELIKVLRDLNRRRVIRMQKVDSGRRLALNLDASTWLANPRVSHDDIRICRHVLAQANGRDENSAPGAGPAGKTPSVGKLPMGMPTDSTTGDDEWEQPA
jgi:hypothetical protein